MYPKKYITQRRTVRLQQLSQKLAKGESDDDEDHGRYIADIPDLEACSAFGETPEQAVAEVLHVKEAWLAVVE